jgi:hypothetical protein
LALTLTWLQSQFVPVLFFAQLRDWNTVYGRDTAGSSFLSERDWIIAVKLVSGLQRWKMLSYSPTNLTSVNVSSAYPRL